MGLHFDRCFGAPPGPASFVVLPHQGGVLLLPSLRGTPLGPAWWSQTGETFVEVPIDGSALALGAEPVVDVVNSHHWRQAVQPSGVAFFFFQRRLVQVTVGPEVRFTPTPYAPLPNFVLQDLALDPRGTWWAAGHASRDSIIGQVFTSPDGAHWEQVPAKLAGSAQPQARQARCRTPAPTPAPADRCV